MSDDNQVNVAITATSDELEAGVNAAADSVAAGTDKMTESVEKMAASTAEATEESESSFRRMADGIGESVAQMNEQLEGFSKAIAGVQKSFALIGEVAMLGFVGEKIADLGKESAEYAEQTEIAAQKTGLSTAAVQELGFAAKMTGVSSEGMNQALMRVSRAVTAAEGGSKQLQAVFDSVGVSAKQLEGMSLDQVLGKVADKFADTEDGSTKAAIAMQLFGRQGSDLIPLLDKGSSGIDELRQKAQELGVVMGEDDIAAGSALNEKLKEMDAQMQAVKQRAGSDLTPAFLAIVEAMTAMDEKGGVLDEMFIGLGAVMKGVVAIGITAAAAFNTVAEAAVTAGLAAEQAATGHFSTASATIKIGLENIEKGASDAQAAIDKLFDSEKQAASVDMGEGGNNWGEKGQLQAPDASGGQGASQIEKWKEQLQEQQEASKDYFKSNLAGEQAFWEQKLALVAKGSKDYIDVQHELFGVNSQLAHQALADDLATIRQQEDAEQGATIHKIELASQAATEIGSKYGWQSAQYKAAIDEMLKVGKEFTDQQTADAAAAIQKQTAALVAGIARQEEAQKSAYKMHEESSQQETANLLTLEDQRYDAVKDEIARELALYDQGTQKYKDLLKEQEKAEEEHKANSQKIANQGAQQTEQAWEQAFRQIDSSINSSILGMIKGTENLQQAFTKVADQMVSSMITATLQMGERWIANELLKTAATEAGNAARTASDAAGAGAGLAAEAAAGKTSVTNSAYRAAAAVYADVAEIPYVGWIMAPPAAAAAFVAVEAFMPSAAGGYYNVPNDGPVNIHQGEMVLPAWAAQGFRNMIGTPGATNAGPTASSQGTQRSGGNQTFNFTIQAMDSQDVSRVLTSNNSAVFTAVKQALRNNMR
jgi:hypothetical protein